MKDFFIRCGILNENDSVSITNLIVFLFTGILAFKMLFSGVVVDTKIFDWKIESPDIANTLPLLFSLMNYGHKRYTTASLGADTKDDTNAK